MLYNYYSEKLLGIQDVNVKNIEEKEKSLEITIEKPRKESICPACGHRTNRIHDYRTQRVRDLSAFGKSVVLLYRKRRYVCGCGKRFYEENNVVGRYARRTRRVIESIISKLAEVPSYTAAAKEHNVSANTVIRYFNTVQYPKPTELPEALGIDEFKGNSGDEKFHCILTDLKNKRVIDILHDRKEVTLCDYFKKFDRRNVKYVVTDMYKPYSEMVKTYFKNATYIIDKYHWIRQMTWAFEAVRKEAQKRFSKTHRIYFKHSRFLLLKREKNLTPEQRQQVDNMLYASADLSTAYFYKEQLYTILEFGTREERRYALKEWISGALDCQVKPVRKCAETYQRWLAPILNSLEYEYTNGFTEGCNNKIKVLKRNAFGFHNFKRFRNRILYTYSAPRA